MLHIQFPLLLIEVWEVIILKHVLVQPFQAVQVVKDVQQASVSSIGKVDVRFIFSA
jgi:hypothetical protein